MTPRHAVFIDFDGTLAEHGVAPHEHADAVRAARAAGHAILLCTGRPGSIVAPEVAELFDGVISSAGAHVQVEGEVLRDDRFPEPLARRAVELLSGYGATFALESPEALWCTPDSAARIRARPIMPSRPGGYGRGTQDIIDAVRVPEGLVSCSFAKISLWGSPIPVEQLAVELGPDVGALPNSIASDDTASGEIHLVTIDKADGLRQAAAHLGIGLSETVGIGDGMNDLGMLRVAGTSIGIEGSRPEILAVSDFTVPRPADLGILPAFERLGLI
ncbi:HAD hydrolase family protein [Brachybacterium alimentarium]|uniref:HAD hydrolase family protein n=1 Tax=Brachybacterium alimentarium TaxID=47845 RepID=UPI003FD4707D